MFIPCSAVHLYKRPVPPGRSLFIKSYFINYLLGGNNMPFYILRRIKTLLLFQSDIFLQSFFLFTMYFVYCLLFLSFTTVFYHRFDHVIYIFKEPTFGIVNICFDINFLYFIDFCPHPYYLLSYFYLHLLDLYPSRF